ncbi:MAG: sodium:calcium antiporter [Promethearchaeota archaeon]
MSALFIVVLQFFALASGFIMIYFSADWLVDNIKALLKLKNISPYILGAILLGVDLEEITASITASILGFPTVAIGNAIGNNTIALTVPFAIPAMIFPYKIKKSPQKFIGVLVMMLVTYILTIILIVLFGITLIFLCCAAIVISLYLFLLFSNIKSAGKMLKKGIENLIDAEEDVLETFIDMDDDDDNDAEGKRTGNRDDLDTICLEDDNRSFKNEKPCKDDKHVNQEANYVSSSSGIGKKLAIIIVSAIILMAGAYLLGEGIETVVNNFRISEHLIGYIIVALGVNIEEFMLIAKSVKKHIPELGTGGILMKVAWNLGITFGISVFIYPFIPVNPSLVFNTLLLAALVFCFLFIMRKRVFDRKVGVLLLSLFVFYIVANFFWITA